MNAIASKDEGQGFLRFVRRGCFHGCMTLILLVLIVIGIRMWIGLMVVQSNYSKWQAFEIKNYSVTVAYGTFAGNYYEGKEIVNNGKVRQSNGKYDQPAIDSLFESARDCAKNVIFVLPCWVDYDEIYGYPKLWQDTDLDIGRTIEISDFHILRTQAP